MTEHPAIFWSAWLLVDIACGVGVYLLGMWMIWKGELWWGRLQQTSRQPRL